MPLISRGYWARVYRIQKTIEEFLNDEDQSKQIISLGAGFDSTYFYIKNKFPEAKFTYIEIDFPDVCSAKVEKILESQELLKEVDGEVLAGHEIVTLGYKLLHGDLREFAGIEEKLRRYTLKEGKTLVIAECVFSYIEAEVVDALLGSISGLFDNLGIIIYDIIKPGDAFGKVMTQNLAARGIYLNGIQKYPSVDSQRVRFSRFFQNVQAFDMHQIYYSCLDRIERDR